MGPTTDNRSVALVKQLLSLPVINRVKVVKELMLHQLDAIHAQVLAVHSIANALLANDSPLLQSSISLVEALQQTRSQVDRQHQQMLETVQGGLDETRHQSQFLAETVQEARGEFERYGQSLLDTVRGAYDEIRQQVLEMAKRAHDEIVHQGGRLFEAVQESQVDVRERAQFLLATVELARGDVERHGQMLLNTVREVHDETRQQGHALLEAVKQARGNVERHGQTLLDTVRGAHDETQQQGQFLLEAMKQARANVERHSQTLLETVRGAHEEARQQAQFLLDAVRQARGTVERHSQTLLETVRGAHDETRQQMLEIVKRAHDDIAHQGHRVLEAVHEGQVDAKQQGQFLLDTVQQVRGNAERHSQSLLETMQGSHAEIRQQMLEIVQRAHDAIAHQGQRLWEAVHEGQIDAKRREESLLDTVQQTRSDVEQQTQSLRETVQGAQEETRQQILEAVKVLQESAGIPGRLLATDASPHRPQLMVGQDGPLDPEAALMTHLYSYLTNRNALDIGANVGHMSSCLLDAGYEVYAFEPYLPVYRELSERLGGRPAFHSFPTAVGPADDTRDLHIASDQSGTNMYRDPTLFSSLTRHAMPDDLVFTEAISVPVRSLQSLHASGDIPARVGLVKIDTEGFDLEVIRGMGACRYDVVVAEYWDAANPFAVSGAMNRLDALVAEMRSRDYHWHIVFHTTWGEKSVGFYCNYPHSLPRTWGNVFFFRDHELFRPALAWCTAVLPPTYVTGSVCR